MNTAIKKSLAVVIPLTLLSLSCSKNNNPADNGSDKVTLQTEVLTNIANNVCTVSYEDMYAKALELQTAVTALNKTSTDANLATAREKWKAMRTTWEQSEAWLFGPVDSESIDPRIDTWPVEFNSLDAILNGTDNLNEAYVDGLEESLKGFHPIEYLLWGQNGNKTGAQLKDREKEFLAGLTQNLVKLSKEARDQWTGGYKDQLAKAGNGSTAFTTQQAAFVQIADAMAGIAGEVGDAKMKEPFDAQNPNLEESPFAKNSITDFTNNIQGVLAIYQGRFTTDGKGLEDIVRANNLSLDAEIKSKHAAAIAALQAIDKPFGEAIISEQSKVQNAMTKVGELATVIDEKLKPFLVQYTK
ncbi:imelysin family protein [Mucilaginibacter phyllosphaerae]